MEPVELAVAPPRLPRTGATEPAKITPETIVVRARAKPPAPARIPAPDVAIEQITSRGPARDDIHVAQIDDPLITTMPDLASRAAAMQVAPGSSLARLETSRVAMLATAPEQVTLRIGNRIEGQVVVQIDESATMTVQLAGILKTVAPHMDRAEFERLASSPAATEFVTLDQLRAFGLEVRYDPAYDELQLKG